MATRTKTAASGADTAVAAGIDEVNGDPTVEPTATKSAPKAAAKAPAKAKAPARAKRAPKAVEGDEPEDGDIEPVVEIPAVEGDDTVKEPVADDAEDDDSKAKPVEVLPKGALVLSIVDDEDDVPVYSSAITGATADPVKDYLKQIGKVALLNAAEEVELAMRIEAGLFAEDKLSEMSDVERKTPLGREL
ncbi:MAG TPA: sigma-70 factor domain-containing protein, partial [Glaciihabitans sp.]|nr:sigma-70 factor domain-containing protein [Glaciihabitans sp.]